MFHAGSNTSGSKHSLKALCRICILCLLAAALLAGCQPESEEYPSIPLQIPETKFRIAYYEGGPYYDYANSFRALVDNLADLGWMEPLDIPTFNDTEDMRSIWEYVSENTRSEYIDFPRDAFWSAGWDDAERERIREDAIERLSRQDDIDLVIAMGTWAGQDLVNDRHSTPTMSLTSSNPVLAGIIEDPSSSGFEHVLVEVDPERFTRNIRLFHDVISFERLGVVYEDSPDGRVYANLSELKEASTELGFEIVECTAEDINLTEQEAYEQVQACYREIAPQIDALWMGAHRGENSSFMPESLEIMMENGIPVWSNQGDEAVRRGALMSIWQDDFDFVGAWYARKAGKILNGASPGDLDQELVLPQQILLNLETARRMGFEFPPGILEIADETYETIEE